MFDRAVAIEQAAQVLADALTDETPLDHDIADGLVQLLEQRQRDRQREIVAVQRALAPTSQDARAPRADRAGIASAERRLPAPRLRAGLETALTNANDWYTYC